MKNSIIVVLFLIFGFLIYGQDYSPGLDETEIINYLRNLKNITEEYQKIYTDEIREIDRLTIEFSLKISFYLYDNEYAIFTENVIKEEFINIVNTFYPKEVYEIMEKYEIFNKNFMLLYSVVNVIYTTEKYFDEKLSNYSKLKFLLSLVEKQDMDLVIKYRPGSYCIEYIDRK